MKLKRITKLSDHPEKWEGKLYDGRMIQISCRQRVFKIKISPQRATHVYDASLGEEIFKRILTSDKVNEDQLHGLLIDSGFEITKQTIFPPLGKRSN